MLNTTGTCNSFILMSVPWRLPFAIHVPIGPPEIRRYSDVAPFEDAYFDDVELFEDIDEDDLDGETHTLADGTVIALVTGKHGTDSFAIDGDEGPEFDGGEAGEQDGNDNANEQKGTDNGVHDIPEDFDDLDDVQLANGGAHQTHDDFDTSDDDNFDVLREAQQTMDRL